MPPKVKIFSLESRYLDGLQYVYMPLQRRDRPDQDSGPQIISRRAEGRKGKEASATFELKNPQTQLQSARHSEKKRKPCMEYRIVSHRVKRIALDLNRSCYRNRYACALTALPHPRPAGRIVIMLQPSPFPVPFDSKGEKRLMPISAVQVTLFRISHITSVELARRTIHIQDKPCCYCTKPCSIAIEESSSPICP
ncbi:uncharacterized protein BDZ83DRAFT_648718 [Colletotrichum acutatum]|uniref:Uncharacterized protein n=1 Tax=Glomerella acutata TaxID=27357 RepID=A0AAD8UW88_GLOAC|nr:uncharacterized protein BDZ83DRAFT_648718 [Colletotrichum acutatum]KAK1728456.1 hypothetical protein BDZ83DRAFT_648718 [Colletotrichum acutatum]